MHRGDVAVMKIASQDNLADPFTKTLPANRLRVTYLGWV